MSGGPLLTADCYARPRRCNADTHTHTALQADIQQAQRLKHTTQAENRQANNKNYRHAQQTRGKTEKGEKQGTPPFNAQVLCIRTSLKKSKINV